MLRYALALAIAALPFGGLAVAACASSQDGLPPDDPTPSGSPSALPTTNGARSVDAAPTTSSDASDDVPTPDAAAFTDAGAVLQRFGGGLDASSTVKFGGSPYCNYTMTIEQIDVSVVAVKNGPIAAADVHDLAVEQAVQPCQYSPTPPDQQSYALKSQVVDAGSLHLELDPATANKTQASLQIDVPGYATGGSRATLRWHRTDQGPPLDWKVTATVNLSAQ